MPKKRRPRQMREAKQMPLTPLERNILACHAAGRAIVQSIVLTDEPVRAIRVPTVLTKEHMAAQLPFGKQQMYTGRQLINAMCFFLAARVAEFVAFREISTASSLDLEHATNLAYTMVTDYGMGVRKDQYVPGAFTLDRQYSNEFLQSLDQEALHILQTQIDRATRILEKNQKLLLTLTEHLRVHGRMSKTMLETFLLLGEAVTDTENDPSAP